MNFFEGGTIVFSFGTGQSSVGNWFGYGPEGGPTSNTVITAQDLSPEIGARTVVGCPSGTDHGYRNAYTCVTAYRDKSGDNVPLRWGRKDPGHFGINWFWYEHEFELHWVERILQSWDDQKFNRNPETGEIRTVYITGITFKYNGTAVSSLEVVAAMSPPLNSIDTAPQGVITAFCRGTDQNSSILAKCPQVLPPPYIAREIDPGNLGY